MNVEQELYCHIVNRYHEGHAPDGFSLESSLLSGAIPDYVTLMDLVFYLERMHSIRFADDELVPEHFGCVRTLARLVENKIAAQNRPPEVAKDPCIAMTDPLMHTYHFEVGTVLAPYVMRRQPARFSSEYVNTDDHGYRLSYDAEGVVNSRSWWQRQHRALAIGDSFVFSSGATSDERTMVSVLNASSRFAFLNLGILAGNSTEELIAAIPFLQGAERILLCSGGVNLNMNFMRAAGDDLYGSFAGEDLFTKLGRTEFQFIASMMERAAPRLQECFTRTRKSSADTPFTPEQIQARLERAIAQQRRDLEILVRAFSPRPVFFAMRPIAASIAKPNLTIEEQKLIEYHCRKDKTYSQVIEPYTLKLVPQYTQALRQICSDLSVPFTDLNKMPYEGWCFIEYGHLNDEGYRQVGQYLAEWMENTIA